MNLEKPSHGHKNHHKKPHCKKCCKVLHFIMFAALIAHVYFIKKLADAQEAVEKLNGTFLDKEWHCSMFKDLKKDNKKVENQDCT
jgi:hypothetical protein